MLRQDIVYAVHTQYTKMHGLFEPPFEPPQSSHQSHHLVVPPSPNYTSKSQLVHKYPSINTC